MSWDDDGLDGLNPEDIFSMVLLNKKRKTKVNVELRDEEGNTIPLAEVVQDLLKYMTSKLEDEEENQFTSQIYPLMGQAMASGLTRFIGPHMAGVFLMNETSRLSFIQMMCLSFLLLKYVQQKKLTIHTVEESISDDEIETIGRKSKASSVVAMANMMGMDYKEVMKKLYHKGDLTRDDIAEMAPEILDELDEVGEPDGDPQ